MLVQELLEQVPRDTMHVVQRSYERYREIVREAVKQETRFVLQWSQPGQDDVRSCTFPIRVDEVGYPEAVAHAEIPEGAELAALLGFWRPSLESLARGAAGSLQLIDEIHDRLPSSIDVTSARDSVSEAGQFARRLLALLDQSDFDVVKHILSVNEHVLGIFRFDPKEGWVDYSRRYSTEIFLYWGVIGFVAHSREWSVDALTVVVLAHELGHAYSHLGFDRDGERWSGHGFANTESRLQEAVAQYYADRALHRLGDRTPGALDVYKKLMPSQPDAYRAHQPWLKDYTSEIVGQALSSARRRGKVNFAEFTQELQRVQRGLAPKT